MRPNKFSCPSTYGFIFCIYKRKVCIYAVCKIVLHKLWAEGRRTYRILLRSRRKYVATSVHEFETLVCLPEITTIHLISSRRFCAQNLYHQFFDVALFLLFLAPLIRAEFLHFRKWFALKGLSNNCNFKFRGKWVSDY